MISPNRINHYLKKHKRYYFRRKMDNKINYSFDTKFVGNILVVGRTGCGKTTFVQNLRQNKMFGEKILVIVL